MKAGRSSKVNRETHTPNTKYGMGDYYGSGVPGKIGKMRDDSMGLIMPTPKKLKTPPKSVA